MSEWWRGCVIYQVYPRSFQDSDGDGVGDLPGIVARLGHIAALGVDAIWLSPITKSPMADMGYDVSDYTSVDPLFGNIEDFDVLVGRAHQLGLRVIMDQVISHTSDKHPWFRESARSQDNAKADWYVWADPLPDGSPPNNWVSVFGGSAWEWNATRRQYYLHNFLSQQPDLNFHHAPVQDAVLEVLRFWLERGVDGFRFDTVNYYFHDKKLRSNPALKRRSSRPEVNVYNMQDHVYDKNRPENLKFLKRVRSLLDEFGATSVGEVGDANRAVEIMAAYTEGKSRLHMAYSFDMLGPDFSPKFFRSRIEGFNSGAPDGWPCWSFSNHDVERHVTRWAEFGASRDALARQAAALLLAMRGSVCLYQGEELGLPETEMLFEELTDPPGIRFWPEYKGRDGCRTPIPWERGEAPNGFTTGKPWLPVKPPQSELSVESQGNDPDSTLNFYRGLLRWRQAHPALIDGEITFFDAPKNVLAFSRTGKTETVIAIFNLSVAPVSLTFEGGFNAAVSPIAGAAELEGANLKLGANGFAYLTGTAKTLPVRVKSARNKLA